MRNRALLSLAVLVLGAAACGREPRPEAAASLPRPVVLDSVPVPLMDRAILRDTLGGEDVEQRTWVVPMGYDSVLAFYRAELPELGWRIISVEGRERASTLHAVKDGPVLWVQLRYLGSITTEVTLIGAVSRGIPGAEAP
jgi:hypothetical protein